MYKIDDELELIQKNKKYPLEYLVLEWRLVINRELYEDKAIDLKVFKEMEKSILARMTRITNQMKTDDLTFPKSDGTMPST